jgi:hypothetical protein
MTKIAASLEVLTDVSTEFMVLHPIMSLIPNMYQKIEDCIRAIASQSFFPSLVPQEEIRHLIPIHIRASLLSVTITASVTVPSFYVDIQIPEFYPAFQVSKATTIPYYKQAGFKAKCGVYTKVDMTSPHFALQ